MSPSRLYRVRWRVAKPGEAPQARWHAVPATTADAKERLLAAARGAAGGELRVSLENGEGATTAVWTNRRLLAAWNPTLAALPEAADGEWSREIALGDSRTSFFRAIRALLLKAAEDGLLELAQAASIAHAVSQALDGAGPFSRARTR